MSSVLPPSPSPVPRRIFYPDDMHDMHDSRFSRCTIRGGRFAVDECDDYDDDDDDDENASPALLARVLGWWDVLVPGEVEGE